MIRLMRLSFNNLVQIENTSEDGDAIDILEDAYKTG